MLDGRGGRALYGVRILGVNLRGDVAGVPEKGLWLEEGLVINLNHSFRGGVWGV